VLLAVAGLDSAISCCSAVDCTQRVLCCYVKVFGVLQRVDYAMSSCLTLLLCEPVVFVVDCSTWVS